MASEVQDLDDLLEEPRHVRLGGVVYRLPYDCPAELYVLMLRLATGEEGRPADDQDRAALAEAELALVEKFRSGVLDLFRVHQPDMDALPSALSVPGMMGLVGRVYNRSLAGEKDGAGADPTPAPPKRKRAAGTRSTRSRSRSGSST